ncbi:hypothetical protein [Haloglycomyces albus]|uniref:hypothetical protein n=1 Tax=Haloglycomyces albus TaxID=526067 RepID=UPI00046D80CC|nr:hypothetical protein [Haloglycomyces albus]
MAQTTGVKDEESSSSDSDSDPAPDIDLSDLPTSPSSPAPLWASTSKVSYSCTHTEDDGHSDWVDCDTTIHND